MTNIDPSLLRKKGRNHPPIWYLTFEKVLLLYPHLRHKPDALVRELENHQKNGSIPYKFEGKELKVPSLRTINDWLAKLPAPSDNELVHFPESFRSRKTTRWEESFQRVVKEDGTGQWVETSKLVDVVLPPQLPPQAVATAAWVMKLFNEKGFESPTIRLVENLYLIMNGINPTERTNEAVQMLALMAAVTLSYGDTSNDPDQDNEVWRYIEGWLAYQGWKTQDTLESRVWYEAMAQREQEIEGATRNDLNDPKMEGAVGAVLKADGRARRRTKVSDGALMKSFPYPEMVRKVSNSKGETINMAFNHPAQMTDSEEGLQKKMESSYAGLKMTKPFTITLERELK